MYAKATVHIVYGPWLKQTQEFIKTEAERLLHEGNITPTRSPWSSAESGRRQAAIEREACEIVDAIKKWRHFLLGRRFRLVTDQQSVRFMFDAKNHRKIKNGKIGVDEQAVNGTASHKGEDRPSANQSQERSPSHRMELWQMFPRITNGLVRQERSPSLKRSEVQLNRLSQYWCNDQTVAGVLQDIFVIMLSEADL
ncbi:hypothetical protein Pcinc_032371 [Petrolisthes cinctipes]|uniref:Reverse transcriptase RNase H-like domain-containing protein n=1 Tax=Petrolisthes cinctipes TaxID=88211 RepID=A0AAE1EU88_PETCI|nr:hypothetical protein Pcinc_032371 [Petrolisthes cinctipes]